MIGTKTENEAKGTTLALVGLLLAAFMAASFMITDSPAYADDIFVVNETGDAKDGKIDGSCDTSLKRAKQCTLRAAIQEANATFAPDAIRFRIPTSSPGLRCGHRGLYHLSGLGVADHRADYHKRLHPAGSQCQHGHDRHQRRPQDGDRRLQGRRGPWNLRHGVEHHSQRASGQRLPVYRAALLPGWRPTWGNRIEGNFIGTDPTGTTKVPNGIGVVASGFATGNDPSEKA